MEKGWHFENIFKCIFLNESYCILIQISTLVSMGPIDNMSALIQVANPYLN